MVPSLRSATRWWCRIASVLAAGVLMAAPARADVDPTGAWSVTFPDNGFPPGPVTLDVHFVWTGTVLVAYVGRFDLQPADQLSGTLDAVTGEFSVSGTQPRCLLGGGGPVTGMLSGTFGPSGDSLVGDGQLAAGIEFGTPIKCGSAAGSATGTRVSTTCGNGTLDAGEACDAGPAGSACCTVACAAVSAGRACLAVDYFCEVVNLCAGCAIGLCDGGGACAQTPLSAGHVCRAATDECDVAESCDGTALTCPPDQRVPGPDTDGDGRNDLCDPCTGGGPVSSQRLSVRKLNASFQTSSVKISGTATMADPSAVDPIQHGLRVLIEDAAGVRRLDETAPPNGPTPMHGGWRVTGNGWSYKPATRSSAVRAVRLTRRPSAPGALEISIRIDDLFGTIAPEGIPVKATLVLDPPFATTGLCGEATFPGPPGVNPSCALVRDGETLACR